MRSLKKLLIPIILLVALIIATAVGLKVKGNSAVETSETQANFGFYNVSNAEIQNLSVTSKEGDNISFSSTIDESGTQIWTLDNDDGLIDISQVAVIQYVSILSSYTSTAIISDPAALSEYGLETPDYTVTITKTDGTVDNIYVGGISYDGKNCYCMVEGDPALYLVAIIKRENCAYTVENFRSTEILNLSYDHIDSIEFIRNSDELDITIDCQTDENGNPDFSVISPFERETNGFFDSTLKFFAKLNVSGFADITPMELAQYRLDEPEYTFIYTLNNGTAYTIELSSNMGGFYYGSCNSYDGYFKIDTNYLEGGLDLPLLNMIDNDIVSFEANEISSIEGSYDGDSFVFDINCVENMTEAEATATLNLRNAYVQTTSGRTYAAFLFENLVTIEIGGTDLNADPEYDPVMTFTYFTKDYSTTTVDFTVRDTNSYYVFIDGEYSGFYVFADELFHYGGEDSYNYGAWSAYLLTQQAIDNAINNIYDMPAESETVEG